MGRYLPEGWAGAVSSAAMNEIMKAFSGYVEIVSPSEVSGNVESGSFQDREDPVLGMISRRPCTAADVAAGLGLHITDAVKNLDKLCKAGKAVTERLEDRIYYRPAD